MKKTELYEEGKKVRNLPIDEQKRTLENVLARLKIKSEEKIQSLKLLGGILEREVKDKEYQLQKTGNLTKLEHTQSFIYGIFWTFIALIGLGGEGSLFGVMIAALQLGIYGILLAAGIIISGVLALESYLNQIERVYPQLYQKVMLFSSYVALICIMIGLFLLADIRGSLFTTQQAITDTNSLEAQLESSKAFIENTRPIMGWVMKFIALAGMLACGVCLHQGGKRIIVSGTTLMDYSKIKKFRKRQSAIASEIKKWEHAPTKGIKEFEAGIFSPEENGKKQRNWEAFLISPQAILIIVIIVIVIITLSIDTANGAEQPTMESVIVLFDITGSSRSTDYVGINQFHKNQQLAKNVIKGLKPGSNLMIIGITERSFRKPYIILRGEIPEKKGFFNEKEARAKLALMNTWDKLGLKPISRQTAIFEAIYLAANLFGNTEIKKLIFISDMMECSGEYNFESSPVEPKVLDKVEKEGLIAPLKGVKIWVLGARPSGRDKIHWNSIRSFWLGYFKRAGAKAVSYSIQ